MESLWIKTAGIVKKERKSLPDRAEAVVIGAGMAGVLTAYFLEERGIETIVLEADRTGSGQTSRTTAKVTSQHGAAYKTLLDRFGPEKAGLYFQANEEAIGSYEEIIRKERISCDWQRLPAYLYTEENQEVLEEEMEAAGKMGITCRLLQRPDLPFPAKAALGLDNQAQFHPLLFLYAAAEKLKIYGDTKVLEAEDNFVRTNRGNIRASYVIFACHYPFINVPGFYFARMHQERSYALALRNAPLVDGMYYSVDKQGLSFRSCGKELIIGGYGHRTGENRGGGCYEGLRQGARELFPGSAETACWSAQDCMTLDGIPYVGNYAESRPGWYVLTGFGKWGMSNSMAAAKLTADLITGRENRYAGIFSPGRSALAASAKNFLKEGGHAVKSLSRNFLAPPRALLEELPKGHGGIVEYGGEKAGVYKDKDGNCFTVNPQCPHLGCQLEWNPDEKSWDCPCHGSRFDYHGNLLDNPSLRDL